MKRTRNSLMVIAFAFAFSVQATFVAKVNLQQGAIMKVSRLLVKNERLYFPKDNITVPVSSILDIEFEFSSISIPECEKAVQSEKFEMLASTLQAELLPLVDFLEIPGNLDEYIYWLTKAHVWLNEYDEARQWVELLRRKKSPLLPELELYSVLMLLEQNKTAKAMRLFKTVKEPEAVSPVLTRVLRGRFALSQDDFQEALRQFSTLIAWYPRHSEWMPMATFYEGVVYLKTGNHEAASNIIEELEHDYSESCWIRWATELKQIQEKNTKGDS